MQKRIRKAEWWSNIDKELLDAFVDNPYECPIVIDTKGIIRFMSRYNSKVYGVTPEQAVGKPLNEIVKASQLCNVLATGKAEIGELFYVGGRKRIIARIPLKDKDGNLIGAVTKLIFHQAEKLNDLHQRMQILEEHVKYYQSELVSLKEGVFGVEGIIGESKMMREAKILAIQAALSDATVLVTGESGTGKELFAEAIHQKSQRAGGPFIKVNCAAIPDELIESELFGYEGGSFTGARVEGKPGKFELAHKGTIFLDEIGDMPRQMQAKLLRVIQEHEIERVGGVKSKKLDFRVIAATNQSLEELIEKGKFRTDLYYRINTFQIRAPSLREIPEDIPRIAYFYLSNLGARHRQSPRKFSNEALEIIERYSWPGNVRELRNAIERAIGVAVGTEITLEDLPHRLKEFYRDRYDWMRQAGLLRDVLKDAERRAIAQALHISAGNKAKAARMLGIHRTGLYQKIKVYGLKM